MKSIINLIIFLSCTLLSNAQTNLNLLTEAGISKFGPRYLVGVEIGLDKNFHGINLTFDNLESRINGNVGLGYQFSNEFYPALRIEGGAFIRFGKFRSSYIDSGAFTHYCNRSSLFEENIGLSYKILHKRTKQFSILTYARMSALHGLGRIPNPCNETKITFYPSIGLRIMYNLNKK